ncbi:MAG TPA: glycoside hydrolase family 3 [Tessaracoccus flavescens]|uniref:beta-N-acetylhexosaminidase n=1 Tax=Tessaracoccus flavescens TaxID=399497 RepID=A0A921EMZ0_9ACTN|nr:glycoside hydrolase family 3 [Tessaracoccus flavescens]
MRRSLTALALIAVGATACAPYQMATPPARGTASTAESTVDSSSPSASAESSVEESAAGQIESIASCRAAADALPEAQRIGQLFMVGVSTGGLDESTRSAISMGSVGSVVLLGSSTASRDDIQMLTASLTSLGTVDAPMLVAVDQEGGTVQRLKGVGFEPIPSAVEQGKLADGELRDAAAVWGEQLREAGVHYDLAPVGDVVPAAKQRTNAPVGKLKRNYGNDAASVTRSVVEFVEGMQDAGIATSVKHFPGLGEVVTNTDFGAAQDTVTTADSPNLEPFRAAIEAGVDSVMVSSAVFENIDPKNEGVFSSVVITDLLRGDLGYDGVVIADDLGAAKSVRDVSPGDRALRFFDAGGDLVINANPAIMGDMISATAERVAADVDFAERVSASAARVLALKAAAGLVDCD